MKIKQEKNLIIYRLENKQSEGPYSYAYSLGEHFYDFWQTKPHVKKYGCPSPKEDGLLPIVNDLIGKNKPFAFGFSSMEQITKWFAPLELTILRDHGFTIKTYNVKKAFVTQYQVLFIKS